jgi:DNA-binding IclR family transcriptional regulator
LTANLSVRRIFVSVNGNRKNDVATAETPGSSSYLGRLLDLLAVIGEEGGLTLSELSRRTELSMSTTHRLANLLVERGFVRRDDATKRYHSGPQLERLGLRSLGRLPDPARFEAVVARLAAATGESVSLGLVLSNEIVLAARRESAHALRQVVNVGDVVSAHTSAMGKAILADLPRDEQLRLVARDGVDPVVTLTGLAGELDEVRREGFARDEQTFAVGLRCVAASFSDGRGHVMGGISVAGPAARFSAERAMQVVPVLRAEVESLSHELGAHAS